MNEKDLASIIREQESGINARERERYMPTAFSTLMRKVYVWMTLALVITGFTAYYVAHSNFIFTLVSNSALMWGLIIAELALVIGLSAAIRKLSLTAATLMFVVYSIINGLTLASIFLIYTQESITQVFFITAGTFAVMALIGYTTKTDLTSLGKYLFMGLIGIIIATLVNLFFHNSMVTTVVSYLGVLIFVGLTAYDTQKIKQMCMSFDYADTNAQKLALLGSLTLYLPIFFHLICIFTHNYFAKFLILHNFAPQKNIYARMKIKNSRMEALKMLISSMELGSQEEVLQALEKEGFKLTQATLSRDLKQLKVAKAASMNGKYVYVLPNDTMYKRITKPRTAMEMLQTSGFVSISFSGNMGVIKTRPGYASSIAYNIDNSDSPNIIGTIAGDDTVFIVIKEGSPIDAVIEDLSVIIPNIR